MRVGGGIDLEAPTPTPELMAAVELLSKLPEFCQEGYPKSSFRDFTREDWDRFQGGVFLRMDDGHTAKAIYGGENRASIARKKLESLGVESTIRTPETRDLICDGENLGPTRYDFWDVIFDASALIGKDLS